MSADRHTELVRRVEAAAARAAAEVCVETVQLTIHGSSRKRLVRVDIDRPGTAGVNLDDCQRMSDALGRILEDEDTILGAYVLEVSSPGVDRPIATADDIRRNTGRRVVVSTTETIEGRREFRGVLTGGDERLLTLREEGRDPIEIPLERVAKAQQDIGF